MANSIRGWVAQNPDGSWTWWPRKPHLDKEGHWFMKHKATDFYLMNGPHRIPYSDDRVEDYTKSLRRYEGRFWR